MCCLCIITSSSVFEQLFYSSEACSIERHASNFNLFIYVLIYLWVIDKALNILKIALNSFIIDELERIMKEAAMAKLEVPGFASAHSLDSTTMTFNV